MGVGQHNSQTMSSRRAVGTRWHRFPHIPFMSPCLSSGHTRAANVPSSSSWDALVCRAARVSTQQTTPSPASRSQTLEGTSQPLATSRQQHPSLLDPLKPSCHSLYKLHQKNLFDEYFDRLLKDGEQSIVSASLLVSRIGELQLQDALLTNFASDVLISCCTTSHEASRQHPWRRARGLPERAKGKCALDDCQRAVWT